MKSRLGCWYGQVIVQESPTVALHGLVVPLERVSEMIVATAGVDVLLQVSPI